MTGEEFAQWMEREGMQVVDLSRASFVAAGAISKWLNGRSKPSPDTYRRLYEVMAAYSQGKVIVVTLQKAAIPGGGTIIQRSVEEPGAQRKRRLADLEAEDDSDE